MSVLTTKATNATAILCHTGTKDFAAQTRRADVIIAAAGKPHMITADMIREGAALVDVDVRRLGGDDGPPAGKHRLEAHDVGSGAVEDGVDLNAAAEQFDEARRQRLGVDVVAVGDLVAAVAQGIRGGVPDASDAAPAGEA